MTGEMINEQVEMKLGYGMWWNLQTKKKQKKKKESISLLLWLNHKSSSIQLSHLSNWLESPPLSFEETTTHT